MIVPLKVAFQQGSLTTTLYPRPAVASALHRTVCPACTVDPSQETLNDRSATDRGGPDEATSTLFIDAASLEAGIGLAGAVGVVAAAGVLEDPHAAAEIAATTIKAPKARPRTSRKCNGPLGSAGIC
jgi:hypothetical protein